MEFIHQVAPSIDDCEVQAMSAYLRSGAWLTEFEKTVEFERRIAEAVGAKHASAVNNGTISLSIALMALGIGPGDEVLVPNFTMIASPNSVTLVGAKPVLVDISSEDLCMDLEQAKAKLTPRTKAIMYVNLNGRGKYLSQFETLCKERGLFLLEDAAHAHGSEWNGKRAGSFGLAGSFSFQNSKIMTSGEGGMLTTNDAGFAERLRHEFEAAIDPDRPRGEQTPGAYRHRRGAV